ncbi:hypothetical protein [Demequina aurantiaca]|uniref:hypothetical protein n=1 Tax=Demequina aurantiaca TaxID=676200 RepID=UPI000AE964B2|nr:hypothetical protein [Demequina aurantiaca]
MRRRIVRWIIIAIAVPIIANILRKSGEHVEKTRGPESKAAKGLKVAGSAVRYVK